MIYTMPVKFFVGDLLTRIFFTYVFLGMLLFAAGVFYFNNTDAEIAEWIYHPLAPYVVGAVVVLLLAPIVVGGIRRARRGARTLTINSETARILFGSVRRGEWRQIDYDYAFTDLGQIEVLRNYESRPNARRTGTVAVDSYELNLYFHTDDTWVGVTESRDRRRMQWEAERLSQLTKVPVTQRNAPSMAGPGPIDRGESADAVTEVPVAPPFLSEREREVIHSLVVKPGKLRARLFPFSFKISDQPGQHLASLLMPVVSHFVNKIPYGRALAAVRYLSADRDASETDHRSLAAEVHRAGWRGERELVETIARVFDAHAGIGADRALIEDRAERYYLWLGDRVRGLSWKYRINFFEVLEQVIKEAPARFAKYQQAPEKLLKLQLSEAYSLKFILDVAAVVVCGFASWFTVMTVRAGVGWGEPGVLIKGIVAAGFTVALIVFWQVLRRKLGRPARRSG